MTKARKGDLVLVRETRSSFHLAGGCVASTTFRLYSVAQCDRLGHVKFALPLTADRAKVEIRGERWVLPSTSVNVPAIREAIAAGEWDADRFDSLEAARNFVREFAA